MKAQSLGKTVLCNTSAALVFQECDGKRSVSDIIYELSERFPIAKAEIKNDVISGLRQLSKLGVIDLRRNSQNLSKEARSALNIAVNAETEYWRSSDGWSPSELLTFAQKHNFIAFTIKNGDTTFEWNGHEHGRPKVLRKFLHQVAVREPSLKGTFVVSADDGMYKSKHRFPVLTCSKAQNDSKSMVLIPDFYYMAGYDALSKRIETAIQKYPWQNKTDLGIWRGSPTGGVSIKENWGELPRTRLCLWAKQQPELVDAKLVNFAQCSESATEPIAAASIIGERLGEEEQIAYKYLLNMDGNSCSWAGSWWKLLSNSLMIQVYGDVEPKNGHKWMQWYHHWLNENDHYISCELDGLESKMNWARENDVQCSDIAARASDFVKEYLNRDMGIAYTALLLKRLSKMEKQ